MRHCINQYQLCTGKKYMDMRSTHSHKDHGATYDLPVTKEYTAENAVSPRTHSKEKHDRLRVRIERVEQPREQVVKPKADPRHLSLDKKHRKVLNNNGNSIKYYTYSKHIFLKSP